MSQQTLSVEVRVYPIRSQGTIRASASLTLGGCFAVRNLRVIEGSKGLFVAMPQSKNQKNEYEDICFPTNSEFRQQINQTVLSAYQQAMEQAPQTMSQQSM